MGKGAYLSIKSVIKCVLGLFALFLMIHYWPWAENFVLVGIEALLPITVGFIIAYIVNIVMSAYEKIYFPKSTKKIVTKSRRPVCMALAYISVIAIVALVIWLVVPQLIDCIEALIAFVPDAIRSGITFLSAQGFETEQLNELVDTINWQDSIDKIVAFLGTGVGSVWGVLSNTVAAIFSWTVTIVLSLIFSIYFLLEKEKLISQISRVTKAYLRPSLYNRLSYITHVLHDCYHKFFVGQFTEAIVLGLLCTIGMLILRLPFAAMIGALVAFTALIPVAGAYIGAIVGAFLIVMENPMQAVVFIIFLLVLQQFEGNVIYPRVVGNSVGLPGVFVLAAVTIGGGISGVGGMLIAVPLTAAVYRLLREDVNQKLIPTKFNSVPSIVSVSSVETTSSEGASVVEENSKSNETIKSTQQVKEQDNNNQQTPKKQNNKSTRNRRRK